MKFKSDIFLFQVSCRVVSCLVFEHGTGFITNASYFERGNTRVAECDAWILSRSFELHYTGDETCSECALTISVCDDFASLAPVLVMKKQY
mmetsp:Transcript_5707/g.11380  ORF Transcript_5707/g.11380 Transcript_5707/m.11380 type:complete len:91 (-) Transcript_5707:32-304(-)